MKKLTLILLLVAVAITTKAQTWNGMFGNWKQTNGTKSSIYTKYILYLNLVSDKKTNITIDNNSIAMLDLKPIANNGLETTTPIEVKPMYGYDAKKVFVRLYNQNNRLRVVRKIYSYDKSGKILSEAQIDSVLFDRVIAKEIIQDAINKKDYNISYQNPNAELIKKTVNIGIYEDATKKLSSYKTFKVTITNVEVLTKGDSDGNSNEKFQGVTYFRDAFEVTGTIDYIDDYGKYLNLFHNGSNPNKNTAAPHLSEVIPVNKPFAINKTFTYALNSKSFSQAQLKFKIDLFENDMKDYGGDFPGKVQKSTNKTEVLLVSTLNWGDNQLLLYTKDGGSLVLNFNIVGQ